MSSGLKRKARLRFCEGGLAVKAPDEKSGQAFLSASEGNPRFNYYL